MQSVTSPKLALSLSGCLRCYTQTTTDPIHLAWMVNQAGWLEPNQRATKPHPARPGGESGCLRPHIAALDPPFFTRATTTLLVAGSGRPEKKARVCSPEKIPTERNPKSSREFSAASDRPPGSGRVWARRTCTFHYGFRHRPVRPCTDRSGTRMMFPAISPGDPRASRSPSRETCPICNFDMRNA